MISYQSNKINLQYLSIHIGESTGATAQLRIFICGILPNFNILSTTTGEYILKAFLQYTDFN